MNSEENVSFVAFSGLSLGVFLKSIDASQSVVSFPGVLLTSLNSHRTESCQGSSQGAVVSWEGAAPGWSGLLSVLCTSLRLELCLGSCVCVLWPPDSDCVELPAHSACGEDSRSLSKEMHLASR